MVEVGGADNAFTLDELLLRARDSLERAGLTDASLDARVTPVPDARTVRYYGTLGLIDRPQIQGRDAHYGRRHLLQLVATKTLQAHGLPLKDIQQRLYGRSDRELETIVNAGRRSTPRLPPVTPVLWREIVLEPGLRLLADDRWTPGDLTALNDKFRRALAALGRGSEKEGNTV